MLLSQIAKNQPCILKEVNLDENIYRRLSSLGMTPGTRLVVLERALRGSVVVKIRGTRFAIGKKFAQGIVVCDAPTINSSEREELKIKN